MCAGKVQEIVPYTVSENVKEMLNFLHTQIIGKSLGKFTFHVHFWNQEHMKSPGIMGNFTCPIIFPTQGHVTFTGHFYEYQKFYVLYIFN